MAEPITLQTLLTYLTLISVPVGVFYHIMTLRNTRKNQELQLETRQAQLFMQIYNRFQSPEFQLNDYLFTQWEWKDFDDFEEKYGDAESYSKHMSAGCYYEGIGVLVQRGLIDVEIVDDLLSGYIIRFWEKFKPVNDVWRERLEWPQSYEWLEYLYNQIKPIVEEQHPELKT
jgi:hypothetical protein